MFIVAPFITVRLPPLEEEINLLRYSQTMEYYTAVNDQATEATACVNFSYMKLSGGKKIKSQKSTYSTISFLQSSKTNTQTIYYLGTHIF